jgi:hypothetical protein
VLNAPIDGFEGLVPVVAMAKGEPAPAHMYLLYAGTDAVTVTRTSRDTLEERVHAGWFSRLEDRVFRDTPLHAGDVIQLAAMRAEVTSVTDDGRPDAVRFEFSADIDGGTILLLSWGPRGFERVMPPPPGGTLAVAPAPLVVADVLKPHVRERAVEEDR